MPGLRRVVESGLYGRLRAGRRRTPPSCPAPPRNTMSVPLRAATPRLRARSRLPRDAATIVRLRSGCGADPDRLAWMHARPRSASYWLKSTGQVACYRTRGRDAIGVRTLSAAVRVFVLQMLISRSSSGARRARVRSPLSPWSLPRGIVPLVVGDSRPLASPHTPPPSRP